MTSKLMQLEHRCRLVAVSGAVPPLGSVARNINLHVYAIKYKVLRVGEKFVCGSKSPD
jgi:hypothetical protein